MKVAVISEQEIDIKSMAEALARSEPSEFAEFWFRFAEKVNDDELDMFAKVMAGPLGGLRKQPLRKLCSLMEYHEIRRSRA